MTIPELYSHFLNSTGVCTDTRNIKPQSLFFALKGDRFNGNTFAKKAIEAGASFSIIDEKEFENDQTLLVEDVLGTLQQLANYHRKQLGIPVIGITGSNGKTTTKELMHAVLSTQYKTRATLGNLNNHIGVPLTILSITKSDEMAIVEMGANHQKEIEFLCSIAEPDLGYITNFGKAHMEGFGGIEGIIKGKSELYAHLKQNNKLALVNGNDPIQLEKTAQLKRITFGNNSSNYPCHASSYGNDNFVTVTYNKETINSNLTGIYNQSNIGAAITLGLYYNIPLDKIKQGIEAYVPSNSRSQWLNTAENRILLDAYNANPSSMTLALENFKKLEAPHKWVILGDMFELGQYAKPEHLNIAKQTHIGSYEQVLLVGKNFNELKDPNTLSFLNTEDALNYLIETAPKGKTILIKGSRSMALEKLLTAL